MVGSCEHYNEPASSVEGEESFGQLSDCQLEWTLSFGVSVVA